MQSITTIHFADNKCRNESLSVKSPLICCIANLFYQFVRRLNNSKQRETRFQATFDAIKGCGFDTSFMKDAKYTYEYKGIACLLVTLRREIAQKCTK